MAESKRIIIIAGPNGAGKTTFAMEFLANEADCHLFVNADLVGRGLSPLAPDRAALSAGRMMLGRIREHVKQGETFAFETTLSGRSYARWIPEWRKLGYEVTLFFLRLPTPEFAMDRIRQRVREGGHGVPEAIVHRRFHAGWRNFETLYRGLVDVWAVYDNSRHPPELLDSGRNRQ